MVTFEVPPKHKIGVAFMFTLSMFDKALADSNIPASGFPTTGIPTKSLFIPTLLPKFMAGLPLAKLKFHNSGFKLAVSENSFSMVLISKLFPAFRLPPRTLLPTR